MHKMLSRYTTLATRLASPIFRAHQSLRATLRYPRFVLDYVKFRRAGGNAAVRDLYPCLLDRSPESGFDRHYLYHPAWASRILAFTKPDIHYDISSILSFSTILSAFIPTVFLDYRPARIELSGLTCGRADLTRLELPSSSIRSLSCMHTLEHIGLGRYGDPVDPLADRAAAAELTRVLMPGGNLLVVVPVGRKRVEFNAHRVYRFKDVTSLFSGLTLHEWTLISETGEAGLYHQPTPERIDKEEYGCGCFWFKKVHV